MREKRVRLQACIAKSDNDVAMGSQGGVTNVRLCEGGRLPFSRGTSKHTRGDVAGLL